MSANNQPRPTTPQPEDAGTPPDDGFEVLLTPAAANEKERERSQPISRAGSRSQERTFIQVRSSQNNVARSSKPQAEQKNSSQKSQNEDAAEKAGEVDDDAQLENFDWVELELRYRAALIDANNVENALNNRFDSYADAFQIWSQSSAHLDNERAQKRLKTRALHVQLSEKELEEKRQHYVNVVAAFKNALELLRSSSRMPMR